jgi:hypothetical protein
VNSPHQNKVKVYINKWPQTLSFRGTAQQRVDLNPLYFYLWGQLKTLLHSAPIKNEDTFHQRVFYACQTICNRPENFESMSMRALIQADILSTCC